MSVILYRGGRPWPAPAGQTPVEYTGGRHRAGSFPSSADLRAGARLLLYTDGIAEAKNKTGEQFGVERLEAAISGPGRSEPAGALDEIIATVVRFRGTADSPTI